MSCQVRCTALISAHGITTKLASALGCGVHLCFWGNNLPTGATRLSSTEHFAACENHLPLAVPCHNSGTSRSRSSSDLRLTGSRLRSARLRSTSGDALQQTHRLLEAEQQDERLDKGTVEAAERATQDVEKIASGSAGRGRLDVDGSSDEPRQWPHVPVLLQEVTAAFDGMHMQTFVDGTVGAGGHAAAVSKLRSQYPGNLPSPQSLP